MNEHLCTRFQKRANDRPQSGSGSTSKSLEFAHKRPTHHTQKSAGHRCYSGEESALTASILPNYLRKIDFGSIACMPLVPSTTCVT
jgi:hypothetical protein